MRSKLKARPLAGVALAAGLVSLLPGSTLSQTPFYQGKTITLLQSTQAGDTSDTMTRAIVPFLKKHVPGEPTIKFEFMPGSGGTKAANHIFSNIRPDGLTIGRIGGGLIANAVLRESGVRYDLNKFICLGSSHSTYHWVFLTRGDAGFKSIEALRSASGVRIGAQAVGHSNYFVGRLFAYLAGLKSPNFVVRYSGSELEIALARGELDGRINNADTLLRRNAEQIAKGAIDLHAIMEVPKGLQQPGFERLPEFDMVRDFRQVGSPYILPPGTPPERVKILQDAMVKTFKDPEFHKEYNKLVGEEPTPVMPEDMERLVKELPRDPEIVELFKKINAAEPLPSR